MMNKTYSDHVDYPSRIRHLKRWNSPQMICESTGNTMDSRGDESLYRPSTLGKAFSTVTEVTAGDDTPFDLVYIAGSHGLDCGASVTFFMVGQGSLGTTPQILDEGLPGYIGLQVPEKIEASIICDRFRILSLADGENAREKPRKNDLLVGPICVGLKITRGALHEGDEVRLSIGNSSGFTWKCLSGRKEFKVIVETDSERPKMRLSEPVVIEILPDVAHHVDVFVTPSVSEGEDVKAVISVRDKHDNRVDHDGTITVTTDNQRFASHIVNGIRHIDLKTIGGSSTRYAVHCDDLNLAARSNWCVSGTPFNLYFGDLHCHDFNSTAEGYPADVYLWARDEKRLDFLSVPVQMHRWIDNEKWHLVKHMNEYFLKEGSFVTFLSFEWQHSHYGDKVIHYLGGDMPYLPIWDERYKSIEGLYQELRKTDAFIVSHHPGYNLDLHVPGTDWTVMEDDIDRLVEIWSMHGSSEGFDPQDRPLIPPYRPQGVIEGLRKGRRFGLVAGSDTHTGRPGGSAQEVRPYWGGLCAVWADRLTRRSLFDAFMARRTYAITGSRIALYFTVNDNVMGSETPYSSAYHLKARIWASDMISSVQFLCDYSVIHQTAPNHDVCDIEYEYVPGDQEAHFLHCRVIEKSGHMAVCSPVWTDSCK